MAGLNRVNPNLLVVCFFLLFGCQQVWSATQIIKRTVTGFGDTREVAIVNALIEAISQINGVTVESKQSLQMKFEELVIDSDEQSEESFSASSNLQQELLREATGYVKSYEVLSIDESTDGFGWEAVLSVEIPKYVSIGQDRSKMRSMTIMPFRLLSNTYSVGDQLESANDVSWLINHNLISEFTQARKFRILERTYMSEFYDEQAFLKSGEVPIEETLRLGQRLGSDFILVGTINEYKITEQREEVLGIVTTKRGADVLLEYRVIEIAPQEIRWSGSLNVAMGAKEFAKLSQSNDMNQVQSALISHIASTITTDVLEVIFPIKVLSIEGRQVTLNQGGSRVKKGDLFNVFTAGNKFVDPDTGRKIRTDGPKVATIRVVAVLPKFSISEVVDGDIDLVVPKAICRRLEQEEEPTEVESATVSW